jgi:hypothetical protein
VSWTGGTPFPNGTNDENGVYVYHAGDGFSLTAPADLTSRELILHVGGWNSGATFTAHLSDGSAVDYTNTATGFAGQYDENYTLIYNAASAGQTLTVTWKMTSGANGNVTLSAAALAIATGSLVGTVSTGSAAANLTIEGAIDWIHWGDSAVNRKSGVTPQLSTYTVVGSVPPVEFCCDPRSLNWTHGTPVASASNDQNGLYISGASNGFSLVAPAGTASHKLTLHLGGWKSSGTLTAHLSDNSAADYVNTISGSAEEAGQYDANYTLTYQSASPNQTLTVTWKMAAGNGNVTLSGVALQ